MNSLILRTACNYLVVMLALFSVFELLRGHNDPGGGFVGGLLIAAAIILYSLAYGVRKARHLLGLEPRTIIGAGLLTAAGSGLLSLVFGRAPFTSLWLGPIDVSKPMTALFGEHPPFTTIPLPEYIPGLGKVGTAFMFDAGVYLVVLGATALILFTVQDRD